MFESTLADLEVKCESELRTELNATTTVTVDLFEDGSNLVYQAKALVLNATMQEMGMGRYQEGWEGTSGPCLWYPDRLWPVNIAGRTALGPRSFHLEPSSERVHFDAPFLSLSLNIGLFFGTASWGLGCDFGEEDTLMFLIVMCFILKNDKWMYYIWRSFNISLFLAGAFGIATGVSPNFVTLASLFAVLGLGVGGNLPVDSAVFLDFIPASHQYLLTILFIWWSIGRLVSALVACPLVVNISCPFGSATCTRAEKSPRFLVGLRRDADAIAVMQRIAKFNGRECTLTVDQLAHAGEATMSNAYISEGQKKRKTLSRER